MKSLWAPLAIVPFALSVAACGGSGSGASPMSRLSSSALTHGKVVAAKGAGGSVDAGGALPQVELQADDDNDSDNYPHESAEDNESALLGRPADAADARAIAAVARRYYAAAAAGDGARGCELVYSPLAESLVEDYGTSPAGAGLHGRTCAAILSELFGRQRARLRADEATLKVVGVRAAGKRATVQLRFQGNPRHYLLLQRERGEWKLAALVDAERPLGVE